MKTLIFVVALLSCFSAYAVGSEVRSGAWTAEVDGDELELTIFAPGDGHVFDVRAPVTVLGGLSQADATASAAVVKFELRRAAGTLDFSGRFADGVGAGEFRFTASESFVREMAARGYTALSDEQLLQFALSG